MHTPTLHATDQARSPRHIELDQLTIASPCHARWEDMEGDTIKRFCAECKLHVHDISAMTEHEAQSFLQSRIGESRTCIRMYKRADGKVLTQDCPVGLRLVRLKLARTLSRCGTLLAVLVGGGLAFAGERSGNWAQFCRLAPFQRIVDRISPPPAIMPVKGRMLAGAICVAPPPKPTNTPAQSGEAEK